MARLVEMPKLSPTMEEGQIAEWHAKEGDDIAVDDLLAEVETDKATMEFRSFDRGVLLKILVDAGSIVKLGAPVAIIGGKGEDISALLKQVQSSSYQSSTAAAAAVAVAKPHRPASHPPVLQTVANPAAAPPPAVATPEAGPSGRVKASPYVRKMARERGIDLRTVRGSGPGGRIVAKDVDGTSASTSTSTSQPAVAAVVPLPVRSLRLAPALRTDAALEPEIRPLSMMRKTIARRLTESKQNVPHFYLTIDVNAGPLVQLRKQLNADLAEAPEPMKVSFNDLIIKAAAIGITRAPEVNASFTADALVYHRRVDISVAVAIEDGLVTPVVRHADRKSVMDIGHEVRDLAARARERKLKPEEMMDGTFSISNLGMYGIDEFAAVINPPEGAILAIGGIRSEPVVEGDQLVAGKRMKLTLSCDHRVVDGAVGAEFLAALRKILEQPTQILAF
jgi:pyruvate dehydrogenase E2 component (dihydrolipoamide acetyltransferase)